MSRCQKCKEEFSNDQLFIHDKKILCKKCLGFVDKQIKEFYKQSKQTKRELKKWPTISQK